MSWNTEKKENEETKVSKYALLKEQMLSQIKDRIDRDINNANIKRSLETQFGVKKPDPALKK